MIDAIVKVAEKVVELARYRELKKEKRFKALIEPIFTALQDVHRDYLLMFDETRLALEAGVELSEVISRLKTRRLQQETSRRVIEARAMLPGSADASEDEQFLRSVRRYFSATPPLTSGQVRRTSQLPAPRFDPLWLVPRARESQSSALRSVLELIDGWQKRLGRPRRPDREHSEPGPEVGSREPARQAALAEVEDGLRQLRERWEDICQTYAVALAANS